MISMTSNADDSIQSTPTHSSRTFKVDDNNSDKTSPGSFDSCSISSKLSIDAVPRSKSTDCLEKPGTKRDSLFASAAGGSGLSSPVGGDTINNTDGQKSPVQRIGVSVVGSNVLAEMKARQEKRTSGLFTSVSASLSSNTISANSVSSSINKLKQTEETVTVSHVGSTSSVNTSATASSVSKTSVNINSVSSTSVTNSSSTAVNVSSASNSVVTTGVSVSETKEKFLGNKNSIVANAAAALNANVNKRPPPAVAPKPRPWSVVGSDRRSGE